MQKLEQIVDLPDGLYKIEDTDMLMQKPIDEKKHTRLDRIN